MPRGDSVDVAILGCGPAGATAGAILARRGYHVMGLDRTPFPRYHIGESLTGTVAEHLRDEGLEEEMKRRGFPVKYGVKVIGANARSEFFVAVSPEPTWQVRRDAFDAMLLEHAAGCGMEHRVTSVRGVLKEGDRVRGVRCRDEDGVETEVRARCVVDATGISTFLSTHGVAGPRERDAFSDQIAVFSQVEGCARDPGLMRDNTMIFYAEPHHWAWLIPLTDEVSSVGVVVPRATYKKLGQEVKYSDVPIPRHVLDWGLREINPDLRERCGGRPWTEPIHVLRDYSYEIAPYAGDGWICAGDAHQFVDPIFSFGVSIAVHEGRMAADAVDAALESGAYEAPFAAYQRRCNIGQEAVRDVVRYFWRFPAFFGVQARGRYREDIMRLFAGACYQEEPLPGLTMMRESLERIGA